MVKWSNLFRGMSFRELVISRLGQLVGAPILRGHVVYVPHDAISTEHPGATAGFHFGTTWMDGTTFCAPADFDEIDNAADLPIIAAFLAWLNVGDHHTCRQWFVQRHGAKKLLRLLDMQGGFGHFDESVGFGLIAGMVHSKFYLNHDLTIRVTWESLASASEVIRHVPDDAIRDCFDGIPSQWKIGPDYVASAIERTLVAKPLVESILRAGNPTIQDSEIERRTLYMPHVD
jgi:hypothetical protein